MSGFLQSVFVLCLASSLAFGQQVSWRQWRNQCLETTPLKTLNSITLVECQQACLEEDDFICMAIEYVSTLSVCYLTNTSSHWTMVQAPCLVFGTDLHELALAATWATYSDSCLNAYADKSYSGVVEVLCQTYCETETEFYCQSFNFNYLSNECGLSRENGDSRMLASPCEFQGIDAHIKETEPIYKIFPKHTLTGASTLASDINITQFVCMERCSAYVETECASIAYEPTRAGGPRCLYLRNNNQTHAITASATMNYAERIERPKWRNYLNTCMIPSARNSTVSYTTQSGCQNECAKHYGFGSPFTCKAVSFDTNSGTCYLHWQSTTTEGVGLSSPCVESGFTYHEMITCSPGFE